MASRDRGGKPSPDDSYIATWLTPLPQPEVREGGDSTWEAWQEADRQLNQAFAPTEPTLPVPLSPAARGAGTPRKGERLTADALMVVARMHNRVCPRPALWTRLYEELGGSAYVDLPPPPVERWIWSKLSDLQKRLRLREHIEWAERHGRLAQVAGFLQGLAEPDWLHMGEGQARP